DALVAGAARVAAGRRLGIAHARLDTAAGDRLHAGAYRRRAARRRVGGRSLHHLSRPGDVVHDRPSGDWRGARGGQGGDGRGVRRQGVPRSRPGGRRRAADLPPRKDPRLEWRVAMTRQPRVVAAAVVTVCAAVSAQAPRTHDLPLKPETIHWGYYDPKLTP